MAGLVLPPGEQPVRSESACSDWSTYNLDWLYDTERFDHLPIEEQVSLYQQRNLGQTKYYKTAVKIFGAPRSRKRLMHAQTQANTEATLAQTNRPTLYGSDLASSPPLGVLRANAVTKPSQRTDNVSAERDDLGAYRDWIKQRKTFRQNLDAMGINEAWLRQKPGKTPLEQRVLTRLLEEKRPRPDTPPTVETPPLQAVVTETLPAVCRPSPAAVAIIERFLHKNKLRLIDLFQSVDRDKTWTVSREDFRRVIKQSGVPISDVMLEDLILTLATDMADVLDYRQLANGLRVWRAEKRESKRHRVRSREVNASPSKFSKANGFEAPDIEDDFLMPQHTAKTPGQDSQDTEAIKNEPLASKEDSTPPTQDMHTESQQGPDTDDKHVVADPDTHERLLIGQESTFKDPTAQGDLPRDSETPGPDREELEGERITAHDDDTAPVIRVTPVRVKSGVSTNTSLSSTSTQLLEPPELDTRREQLLLSSPEAMLDISKHNRHTLSQYGKKKRVAEMDSSVIKTMDAAADRHLSASTLGGQTAQLLHNFRQLKYREYLDVCQLCQERNVPLTKQLLQKVFLYPNDKPHSQLEKRIRQPLMPLISQRFHKSSDIESSLGPTGSQAAPYASSNVTTRPPGSQHKAHSTRQPKARVTHTNAHAHTTHTQRSHADTAHTQRSHADTAHTQRSHADTAHTQRSHADTAHTQRSAQAHGSQLKTHKGQLRGAATSSYSQRPHSKGTAKKEKLSTGKTLINTKVDCWMTFEEYDRITRHLSKGPTRALYLSDDNAFWPGQLLDKMRICLPQEPPPAASLFHSVDRKPTLRKNHLVIC